MAEERPEPGFGKCTCGRIIWGKKSLRRGLGLGCQAKKERDEREKRDERERLEAEGQMSLLEEIEKKRGGALKRVQKLAGKYAQGHQNEIASRYKMAAEHWSMSYYGNLSAEAFEAGYRQAIEDSAKRAEGCESATHNPSPFTPTGIASLIRLLPDQEEP